MSYTSLLIETCTISRNTPGAAGNYGTPAPAWADYLTDQACRRVTAGGGGSKGGREIYVGAEVVVADYTFFLQDIDVTEQDRIISGGVSYEVLMVDRKQGDAVTHHKEAHVRTVR